MVAQCFLCFRLSLFVFADLQCRAAFLGCACVCVYAWDGGSFVTTSAG